MQLSIGTSGWMYKDWNGAFYPQHVKGKDQLAYYASHFPAVEINSTFYHMPLASSVQRWYDETPDAFRVAVKLNRYLTQTKHLAADGDFNTTLRTFYERIAVLKEKLGIVLVQLPPSMRQDIGRVEAFAHQTRTLAKELDVNIPLAIECRHVSWLNEEVFATLRTHDLAWVIGDSPGRWPAAKTVTGSRMYIRFHGAKQLYRSSYSNAELEEWATYIRGVGKDCAEIFAFFNNDYNAVAIRNAKTLTKLLRPD